MVMNPTNFVWYSTIFLNSKTNGGVLVLLLFMAVEMLSGLLLDTRAAICATLPMVMLVGFLCGVGVSCCSIVVELVHGVASSSGLVAVHCQTILSTLLKRSIGVHWCSNTIGYYAAGSIISFGSLFSGSESWGP